MLIMPKQINQVAWKDSQSVFRCRFYQSYKNDAKKKN